MTKSFWVFSSIMHILVPRMLGQVYSGQMQSLTSLPTDIPVDTVEIDLFDNEINSFPEDAFAPFYQLQKLGIGRNPFTRLPNLIPVGNTLGSLSVSGCKLWEVNATVFDALVVLYYVSFRNCVSLQSIPDVPGPGLAAITVSLEGTNISTFPPMSNYKMITALNLQNVPLREITEDDIQGMVDIDQIDLGGSQLQTLPDAPTLMQTLTLLEISNTGVSVVPLMCTASTLSLMASGSAVSMCTCENVWLSALHGQRGWVTLDSLTCGSASTTAELLKETCTPLPTNHDKVRMGTVEQRYTDFFCAFPVHSFTTGISKFECMGKALSTLGCSSFGFRPTDDTGMGNCAVIAPTDAALMDIPDADSPRWIYFSVYW